MEYNFSVPFLSESSVTTLTSSSLSLISRDERERLRIVVDNAGRRSAQAQDLGQPITSLVKLVHSDHVLHVCTEEVTARKTVVVGIIKTGRKKLFIYNDSPVLHEIEPLCILDFYVHESVQRKGYGKKLFEHVLQHEKTRPEKLAYDRPSAKFLAFLGKHYNLSTFVPQRNNFVVFRRYFTTPGATSGPGRQADRAALCAVSQPGDAWTPISQRPLTAKRKFVRREQQPHQQAQQAKAQAFHKSENFSNFRDPKMSRHLPFSHHRDAAENRGAGYGGGHSPASRPAAGIKTTASYLNGASEYDYPSTSSPPSSHHLLSERNGNVGPKYGRRSGNSPKIGYPTSRLSAGENHNNWQQWQPLNVQHQHTFNSFRSFSGQSKHHLGHRGGKPGRSAGMKHMAGQGAAQCLVW